ncbi:unnamed protein product, partial [Prorocentrum cordatum]
RLERAHPSCGGRRPRRPIDLGPPPFTAGGPCGRGAQSSGPPARRAAARSRRGGAMCVRTWTQPDVWQSPDAKAPGAAAAGKPQPRQPVHWAKFKPFDELSPPPPRPEAAACQQLSREMLKFGRGVLLRPAGSEAVQAPHAAAAAPEASGRVAAAAPAAPQQAGAAGASSVPPRKEPPEHRASAVLCAPPGVWAPGPARTGEAKESPAPAARRLGRARRPRQRRRPGGGRSARGAVRVRGARGKGRKAMAAATARAEEPPHDGREAERAPAGSPGGPTSRTTRPHPPDEARPRARTRAPRGGRPPLRRAVHCRALPVHATPSDGYKNAFVRVRIKRQVAS